MCMKKKADTRIPIRYKTPRKMPEWTPSDTTTNHEENETVRTNIVMDSPLVMEAQAVTGITTKTGVVHHALKELVRRKKMKDILEFQGKVEFWPGFEKEMA